MCKIKVAEGFFNRKLYMAMAVGALAVSAHGEVVDVAAGDVTALTNALDLLLRQP